MKVQGWGDFLKGESRLFVHKRRRKVELNIAVLVLVLVAAISSQHRLSADECGVCTAPCVHAAHHIRLVCGWLVGSI